METDGPQSGYGLASDETPSEFPIGDRSTANYDHVAAQVGEGPFPGLIAHTAGFDDEAGVFRILDVWETREDAERFLAEQIQPLIEQGADAFPNPDNFTQPTRDGFHELHHVGLVRSAVRSPTGSGSHDRKRKRARRTAPSELRPVTYALVEQDVDAVVG